MKIIDMMCPSIDNAETPDTGERVTDGLDGFERGRWVTATVYGSDPADITRRLIAHRQDTGPYALTLVDCERLERGGELVAPLESIESLTWHAAMAGAAQLLKPERVTFWRGLHHGLLPGEGAEINPAHYPHTSLCPPSDRVYWRPHWTAPRVPDDPRIKLWFVSPTLGGAGSGREYLGATAMVNLLGAVMAAAAAHGADVVLWDAPAGRDVDEWRGTCWMFALEATEARARVVPQGQPTKVVMDR